MFEVVGVGNVAWSRYCNTHKRKGEITVNANFDLNWRVCSRPYVTLEQSTRSQTIEIGCAAFFGSCIVINFTILSVGAAGARFRRQ